MAKKADSFTIGSLARAAGLPVSTLRYYERRGLLLPEARTESSYRIFGPTSLERLRFIRAAQSFGFTLEDIEALLELDGGSGASCSRVRAILARRREEVERRIAELERVREMLSVSMDWCLGSRDGEGCRVLEELGERARGAPGSPLPPTPERGPREIARDLGDLLSGATRDARLFLACVRLLAEGHPIEPAVLALELDRDEGDLRAGLLELAGAERDDSARLVGLALCLERTPQRFETGGLSLFAWGPFETLLLPPLLGRSARVGARDASGNEFRFVSHPDGVEVPAGDEIRLGLALPPASETAVDPRGGFSERCAFLRGSGDEQAFRADCPSGLVLDLEAAHAVARHLASTILARAGEAPPILGD